MLKVIALMLVGALCVAAGVGIGYAAWHRDTVTTADLRKAGMQSAAEVERHMDRQMQCVNGYGETAFGGGLGGDC